MFITSFGEQNITYKCCSNFLIHLSHFSKIFKKTYGISPKEFREGMSV
ncbi:AraC family transcriptional regulator [Acinetobacter sp. BEC1-S18-ESBL-01]|nr:AraC family transcriptional regulator [Acinetobacter sp. BEC1-S18-ESBL-01]